MGSIRLVKPDNDYTEVLGLVRNRAIIYNKTIHKYVVNSIGRIPVPVKNAKELLGKFNSIKEYIESNKKWIKLRDFDDTEHSFEDWTDVLIRNWDKILIIFNSENITAPIFNVIMSSKMEKMFWRFYNRDDKVKNLNKKKVTQESSDKLTPTMDSDIDCMLYYANKYPEMSLKNILLTFRRDFSNIFIALVISLKKKGLSKQQILENITKRLRKDKEQ